MLKILLYVIVLFSFGDCIVCPADYTPVNEGCFLAASFLSVDSWESAQYFCNNVDGYLARIKSCSLLADLVRYFHFYDLEAELGYWIDATDVSREGDWRWGDQSQISMGAPFWGWTSISGSDWINEPNGAIIENCGMLLASDRYRFHDQQCDTGGSPLCQADPLDLSKSGKPEMKNRKNVKKGYVTSNEISHVGDCGLDDAYDDSKAASCPGDFVMISGSCFHFEYNSATNWNDAYTLCRDNYDSHLAVLDTCDLFQAVVSVIRNNETYDLQADHLYWLGGTDEDQEGHWYWTNLAPMAMGPPFWGVTGDGRLEPSGGVTQNCANMFKDDQYYFHDTECEKGGHAICQRDPME